MAAILSRPRCVKPPTNDHVWSNSNSYDILNNTARITCPKFFQHHNVFSDWSGWLMNITSSLKSYYDAVDSTVSILKSPRPWSITITVKRSYPMLRLHDEVMTWKRVPHSWPIVRGFYHLPFDSCFKSPVVLGFGVSHVIRWNKLLNNQLDWRWFVTPWRSIDITVMLKILDIKIS